MATTFPEIQSQQRRGAWALMGILSGVYFVCILLPLLLVRWLAAGLSSGGSSSGLGALVPLECVAASFAMGCTFLALQVWFARSHAVDLVLRALEAEPPDETDRYHVRFRHLVEEMAIAAGRSGEVRAVVAPSVALTAFAAEDGRSGAVIGVTEALLSRLNRAQTQAVVAHEMAHVREGDAVLTCVSCAMLAPFMAVVEIAEKMDDFLEDARDPDIGGGRGSAALAYVVTFLMRLVCTTLSRRRELLADAGAVELTRNPLALAEALHKIAHRHHFLGGRASAYAPIFIVDPSASGLSQGTSWASDLFSSHPPIRARLEILLEMAHAGADVLDGQIPASDSRNGPEPGPAGTRWLLRRDMGWSDPMPLDQIMEQEDFGPAAWVTRHGRFSPVLARKDPILLEAMKAQAMQAGALETTAASPSPSPSPGSQEEPCAETGAAPPTGVLGGSSSGPCPRCVAPLRERDYEGALVEACLKCGGMFVRQDRIQRILARREATFSETFRRKARQWRRDHAFRRDVDLSPEPGDPLGGLACPRCSLPMARRFYSYQHFIVVDRCYNCRSVWFDKEELEMLQALLEGQDGGSS